MKEQTRKRIITMLVAAALMTSLFTACSQEEEPEETTAEITTTVETTALQTENLADVVEEEPVSVLYLNWYDNPDVEADADELPEDLEDTGETTVNDLFKIYTDGENKYIISGRTLIQLDDEGKIPEEKYGVLRLEETGEKVYIWDENASTMTLVADDFEALLAEEEAEQITDYEERTTSESKEIEYGDEEIPVYFNNITTGLYLTDGAVNITELFDMFQNQYIAATLTDSDNEIIGYKLNLQTAAGTMKVTLELTDTEGVFDVKISGTTSEQTTVSAVLDEDNNLFLAPEVIKAVLGFDVDCYENGINIISDVKDIYNPDYFVDYITLYPAEETEDTDAADNDAYDVYDDDDDGLANIPAPDPVDPNETTAPHIEVIGNEEDYTPQQPGTYIEYDPDLGPIEVVVGGDGNGEMGDPQPELGGMIGF